MKRQDENYSIAKSNISLDSIKKIWCRQFRGIFVLFIVCWFETVSENSFTAQKMNQSSTVDIRRSKDIPKAIEEEEYDDEDDEKQRNVIYITRRKKTNRSDDNRVSFRRLSGCGFFYPFIRYPFCFLGFNTSFPFSYCFVCLFAFGASSPYLPFALSMAHQNRADSQCLAELLYTWRTWLTRTIWECERRKINCKAVFRRSGVQNLFLYFFFSCFPSPQITLYHTQYIPLIHPFR